MAVRPRVIALNKHEGQSFGFFLRVEAGEDGHLIRNLEMGGVAELAGLKDGDRIIRVNGSYVDSMEHAEVADMVRRSRISVTFHILDEASYKWAKASGVDLSEPQSRPGQPTMNGVSGPAPKPKLCYLQKSTGGYGFSLKSTKGQEGLFMMAVTPTGVADKAGVKVNDRFLEVNGENVESATHEQVAEKVKAAGTSVMFLLVDEDTDRYYKNKQIRLGVGLATMKHLPQKPRIADMAKASDGYGYFLGEERNLAGHYIKAIDRGSPAEGAGLKEKDRLVAVNGEEVDHCTHEQVVDRIRQCGDKCCLLVVDSETDKMYKMGGASPLLFLEEMRGSRPQPSQPEPIREPKPRLEPDTPTITEEVHVPKLCRLEKTAAGYGFHLNGIQGVYGQHIKEVVRGGAADRAGLEEDDVVVEVNGVNVETTAHEEVVDMIRSTGNTLLLLVSRKSAYDQLKARGVAITPLLLARDATPEPRSATPEPRKATPEPQSATPEPRSATPEPRNATPEPRSATPAIREEEKEREEEKREEEKAARPDTPPSQARERTPSVSSASSCGSVDERF